MYYYYLVRIYIISGVCTCHSIYVEIMEQLRSYFFLLLHYVGSMDQTQATKST